MTLVIVIAIFTDENCPRINIFIIFCQHLFIWIKSILFYSKLRKNRINSHKRMLNAMILSDNIWYVVNPSVLIFSPVTLKACDQHFFCELHFDYLTDSDTFDKNKIWGLSKEKTCFKDKDIKPEERVPFQREILEFREFYKL